LFCGEAACYKTTSQNCYTGSGADSISAHFSSMTSSEVKTWYIPDNVYPRGKKHFQQLNVNCTKPQPTQALKSILSGINKKQILKGAHLY